LQRWYAERKELQKKLSETDTEAEEEYWDKRQLVKKINLNSLYGAILNPGCRFFDKRIGQSTTLTGRSIAKHMDAYTNECITGEYDHIGESIIYGDSVTGDTLIKLSDGSEITIEELYNKISYKVIQDGNKEYAIPTSNNDSYKVLGYNSYKDEAIWRDISYVMRHQTAKKKYKIKSESGKEVIVTEDHSLIVDRDGFTHEVKPSDLREDDLLILVADDK